MWRRDPFTDSQAESRIITNRRYLYGLRLVGNVPCSGEKPLKPAPRPPTPTTVTLTVATVATATSATAGRAVFWPNRKCGSSRCGPPYAPSRPANHSVVSLDLPWEDRLCLAAWAKVPFSSVIPKQGSFSFEPTPTIDLSQHPFHPSHPSSNDSSILRSFDCSPRAAAVPVSRPRPRPRCLSDPRPVARRVRRLLAQTRPLRAIGAGPVQ